MLLYSEYFVYYLIRQTGQIHNMSQISKAKQRILSKPKTYIDIEQNVQSKFQKYPRKFTVSSLTNQMEKKSVREQISPRQLPFNRTSTETINHHPDMFETPFKEFHFTKSKQNQQKSHRSIASRGESAYMTPLHTNRQGDTVNFSAINQNSQTVQMESPPKMISKRLLHSDKINLILAPVKKRIHNSPFKPKQTILEYVQAQIVAKKQMNRCFVDEMFPPQRTIIFNKKILYQEEGLKFQRLSRIYHNDIEIVKFSQPTYLNLGKYTNPYLYSALCILSEEPSRVLDIFGPQQYNEDGIYYLQLCKDGVWRYILIDDFVPVKITERKQLLFLHSREIEGMIEIWPALIEKAIAKIYGTYLDLAMVRGDGMSPLFRILTGAPITKYVINKDFRSYLIVIDAALKRKHIVTLEGIAEEHQETAYLKNLNVHQSYRVMDIKKSGLKIRNFGEADLVTKLAFDQCLIFHQIIIYRLEPNYVYLTQKLRHKKQYFSVIQITVPHQTKGYFDVWQNNPAYYKKHLGSNIEYSLSPYIIYTKKQEENEEEYDTITVEAGKQIELKSGVYLMHIHLCQAKEQDFTLSYYGEKEVQMTRVKNMEQWYEDCHCKGLK